MFPKTITAFVNFVVSGKREKELKDQRMKGVFTTFLIKSNIAI